MSQQEETEQQDSFDEEREYCDCCGRAIDGYDGGSPCPFCCPSSFAPGSEECDCCRYSNECGSYYDKL